MNVVPPLLTAVLAELPDGETKDVFQAFVDAFHLEPCHASGEHDPTHTPRYGCALQAKDTLMQIAGIAGTDIHNMPRQLHAGKCLWCVSPELEEWAEGSV